jgi:hypothetical protein
MTEAKILVVEDEIPIRKLIVFNLERSNYEVMEIHLKIFPLEDKSYFFSQKKGLHIGYHFLEKLLPVCNLFIVVM